MQIIVIAYRVIATCRNPDGAADLQNMQSGSDGRLDIVQLDCTDEKSIANAASQVSHSHQHLDLLLNVAGILHVPGKMSPGQHHLLRGGQALLMVCSD